MCIYCPSLLNSGSAPVLVYLELHDQGLKFFPKVHWSRTNEHQESTGPEKCSTGPEYGNGGNKIC